MKKNVHSQKSVKMFSKLKLLKLGFKVQIWEETFFRNSEKFGNSFIKNDIIYMSLPFLYKTPLFQAYLKLLR